MANTLYCTTSLTMRSSEYKRFYPIHYIETHYFKHLIRFFFFFAILPASKQKFHGPPNSIKFTRNSIHVGADKKKGETYERRSGQSRRPYAKASLPKFNSEIALEKLRYEPEKRKPQDSAILNKGMEKIRRRGSPSNLNRMDSQ